MVMDVWRQHLYTETVLGYEIHYLKYLDFLWCNTKWGTTDEDRAFWEYVNAKNAYGTPLTEDELTRFASVIDRQDVMDAYACCFVKQMSVDELKDIMYTKLNRADSELLEERLRAMTSIDAQDVHSIDKVRDLLLIGFALPSLCDLTIQQVSAYAEIIKHNKELQQEAIR